MNSTSFSTNTFDGNAFGADEDGKKKSSTSTESFITISSNNSSISNESCCENISCIYCYNVLDGGICDSVKKLHMNHSALRPIKNNETAQGVVYKCNIIEYCMNFYPKTVKTVVKTSKHIDFVLENEIEVWKRVSVFNSPHFARVIKTVPMAKRENRIAVFFEEINTYFENGKYISGAYKLYNKHLNSTSLKTQRCISLIDLLKSPNKHPSAVLNCVRQTLAAVIMYENVGITHYDLHADNIMIRNTPYDIHVYKINDTIIPIMTFGIAPVIIDFGLSHVDNSNWAAINYFLYQGVSTFYKDPIIDCILLLTTVKTHM
jgi:hypothetical protein